MGNAGKNKLYKLHQEVLEDEIKYLTDPVYRKIYDKITNDLKTMAERSKLTIKIGENEKASFGFTMKFDEPQIERPIEEINQAEKEIEKPDSVKEEPTG